MPGQDGRINVAILAVPEVTASALYGMFDLFSSPGRDWSFIVAGEAGAQLMFPYIVARERGKTPQDAVIDATLHVERALEGVEGQETRRQPV